MRTQDVQVTHALVVARRNEPGYQATMSRQLQAIILILICQELRDAR